MSWASERLDYLRGIYTRGQIQSETGIHWRTQEAVLAGRATLSDEYRPALRSYYGRTTYGQMRESGFNVSQASRFRGSPPSLVLERLTNVQTLIRDLSTGSLLSQYNREDRPIGTAQYYRDLVERTQAVTEGMRSSVLMYEQWLDDYRARLGKK